MPLLRCTEPECGHRFYEASRFADQCPECGATAVADDGDEERRAEFLSVPGRVGRPEEPHPAHARKMALKVLREHGVTGPPVPVLAIARRSGLEVVERDDLGSLSARLINGRIEVAAAESDNRKRFSISHELGHHFLNTQHDSGQTVEREADAFAGELLVPGHFLRAAIEQTASTEELRRIFRVSRDVMEIAASIHKLSDRIS